MQTNAQKTRMSKVFRFVHQIDDSKPRQDWPKDRVCGASTLIKVKVVTSN